MTKNNKVIILDKTLTAEEIYAHMLEAFGLKKPESEPEPEFEPDPIHEVGKS